MTTWRSAVLAEWRTKWVLWAMCTMCAMAAVLTPQAARAEDRSVPRITLYYNERPPYFIETEDGAVKGLSASIGERLFIAAGVPFTWAKLPTNRQFLAIQHNLDAGCMIGVYRNPERERYAKFTRPVYRNERTVALAHKSLAFTDGAKLEDLLSRKDVRVLVKEMFSYGRQLDAILARTKPQLVRTTNENLSMAKMVGMHQADLMFASEEEATAILERAGPERNDLRILHFADSIVGPERHIMCSKRVPDEIITRLNQAIH